MAFSKPKSNRPLSGAAAMGAGPGRPKGMPNKATVEFRQTVRALLEDNAENVGKWLTAIAEGDIENGGKREPDPYKALDMMAKLAEYAAPKLGRVEHVGDGGGPIQNSVTVEFVKRDDSAAT